MSQPVIPVALVVHKDEKAWRLKEVNLVRPPVHQWHRYQFVWVERGGVVYEWCNDLGPSENFTAPGCDIPSLWEHSVAELQDMAERHRYRDDYWQKFMAEQAAESTLFEDWRNQVHERHEVIHNRSIFGPLVSKQRNGFPLKAALRGRS